MPPTIGVAALIETAPGNEEAAMSGILATYQPQSGPVTLSALRGSELDLDDRGLDGQTRQRVGDRSRFLALGGRGCPRVRTGSFKTTIRPARVSAVARLGPNGIEGRLEPGPFRGFSDSLVLTDPDAANSPGAVRGR